MREEQVRECLAAGLTDAGAIVERLYPACRRDSKPRRARRSRRTSKNCARMGYDARPLWIPTCLSNTGCGDSSCASSASASWRSARSSWRIGHYEDVWQWVPVALLGVSFLTILAHVIGGGRRGIALLQVLHDPDGGFRRDGHLSALPGERQFPAGTNPDLRDGSSSARVFTPSRRPRWRRASWHN